MLVIGIDPHKHTHTATALDTATGTTRALVQVRATAEGYAELSAWCQQLDATTIAVENLRGLGIHLATWLTARGFDLVDIPPGEVRARRKGMRAGRDKNDTADALAVALAAAHGAGYRHTASETGQIAALLTEERDRLNAEQTAKRNRLHAHLRALTPGGAPIRSSLAALTALVDTLTAHTTADAERIRQARALLAELDRLHLALAANERRMSDLIDTCGTGLRTICGIGTIGATAILAAVAPIDRFTSEAALARYAGAAPRQIASADRSRHRLDRRGNTTLRRALHVAARTQAYLTHGPGHDYYQRKLAEGKTNREALRCLKRQLIKIIWRTMHTDPTHPTPTPTGA